VDSPFLPTRVASEIARGRGPRPNDLEWFEQMLLTVSLTSTVALLSILVWTSVRHSDTGELPSG
jgi:hypothetical protein